MKLYDYDRQILQHIIRYAVSMAILQTGELANALTNEFRDAHREIPWRAVIGMRNRFAHTYGNMNFHTVRLAALVSVPDLREPCQNRLDDCTRQEKIKE